MAESKNRFSVASIPTLANKLTPVQKQFLNEVWNHFLAFGKPFPLRMLPKIIGKQSINQVFVGLSRSLVSEKEWQGTKSFELTVHGAFLTASGQVLAVLLTRLLDLVKRSYENNNFIEKIEKNDIKELLRVSNTDIDTLFRLLRLQSLPEMPFYLASFVDDGSSWAIAINDKIVDLIQYEDSVMYLDHCLSAGYRPEDAYPSGEPLTPQPQKVGDPLQNSSLDRSSIFDLVAEKNILSASGGTISEAAERSTDWYEVATKLDLAKVYGEMGDVEGAWEILQEVLKQGDPTQRRNAQEFLEKLGPLPERVTTPRAPGKKKAKQPSGVRTQTTASSALSSTRTEAEAKSDLLGREKLTQALHRLLTEREDDYPFAIGLFGHWGAGKSSQVNFLQDELKKTGKSQILVSKFNAWQNEKATNLAAMLAQAVVDGLVADKSVWEKFKLAVQLAASRHSNVQKIIERSWRSLAVWLTWARALLLPILFLVVVPVLLWLDTLKAAALAFIPAVVGAFYSVSHFMRSHLTEWFKWVDVKKFLSMFSLPDYSTHRGLILDIHRTLHDLCKLCLKGDSPKDGSYLLLVVDDLDRCGVDTVKDVLDAVRLVASIPRVVTIVAIDERMAFAAVEKHYHQFGHAGRPAALVARDYLAKVLQVSVTLPEVDSDGIAGYVDRKIFGDIVAPPITLPVGESSTAPKEFSANRNDSTSTQSTIVQNAKTLEATKPIVGQTPSFEALPVDHNKQVSLPKFSLPEEKELFKNLAQAYNFSNPRLLWRLYMAWKMLKSLTLDATYSMGQVETPMQLLFWREWLHQLPAQQTDEYSVWIKSPRSRTKPKSMSDAIYDIVTSSLRPVFKNNIHMIKVVDAVLLPSSPSQTASADKPPKPATES